MSTPQNPLEGLEQGRWQVIEPERAIEGRVISADYPSSGGAYWAMIETADGAIWAKFYPSFYPGLRRPKLNETVRLTGAYCSDNVYNLNEIIPVWRSQLLDPAPNSVPFGASAYVCLVDPDKVRVRYTVLATNYTETDMPVVYIAAVHPDGGVREWIGPVGAGETISYQFEVDRYPERDYRTHLFAHWLTPQEGFLTTEPVGLD